MMKQENLLTNALTLNEMSQSAASCAPNLFNLSRFFVENMSMGTAPSMGASVDQLPPAMMMQNLSDAISHFAQMSKPSPHHQPSVPASNVSNGKPDPSSISPNSNTMTSLMGQMNPFLFHQMYLQNPTLFQSMLSQFTTSASSTPHQNPLLNMPPWTSLKQTAPHFNQSPIESSLEEHYGSTSSSPSSPSHLQDSFDPLTSGSTQTAVPGEGRGKRIPKGDSKTRKSGFQAGVTVGYTYDAFFISDGRSKRRKMTTPKSSAVGKTSVEELQMPSSASSSSESSVLLSPSTANTSAPLSLLQVAGGATVSEEVNGTTGRQSRYTCSECGKNYATSSNLSRHKQTHRSLDSKLAKKCPHCGKAYVSMPALSMHILTHDLRHRCDICGKAFSRPWLLQGHRRAHTGEKPYGCAHCGRAFADRSNLRAHMQIHSQMKQFECKVCHKGFALKSYLNKHMEFSCNGTGGFGQDPESSFSPVKSPSSGDPIDVSTTNIPSTITTGGASSSASTNRLPHAMSIAALVGEDV